MKRLRVGILELREQRAFLATRRVVIEREETGRVLVDLAGVIDR